MHLFFQGESVLRVRTGEGFRGVDAIAWLHFLDALTDGFDHSSGVRAGRVGKRRFDGVSARAHVSVIGIHTCGVDTHENLAGGGFWRGDFLELQDFETAKLTNDNRFHCFSPAKELANAKKWCQGAAVKEN